MFLDFLELCGTCSDPLNVALNLMSNNLKICTATYIFVVCLSVILRKQLVQNIQPKNCFWFHKMFSLLLFLGFLEG